MALLTPSQRIEAVRFSCACCGNEQSGLMALYKPLPDSIHEISEDQRAARTWTSSDLCVLDDTHFFVRAVLAIPILETDETLEFGAWGTLSRENFELYLTEFNNPAPEFGPFFSWLNSTLWPYPETFNLASDLHFRGDNLRPLIQLHASDHPLAIDQREGITVDRVAEIYAAWGHTALL